MGSEVKLARHGTLDSFAAELAAASSDAIRIEPVSFRSVLNLRGRATDDFSSTIEAVCGVPLPLEPNRWNGTRERAAIWIGPEEWLLVASEGEAGPINQAIRCTRADDPLLAVVDVSHNYTTLAVSGPRVRDVLATGCSLDFRPGAFGSGECAQTLLVGTQVLLRALEDGKSIELWSRNSFAHFLARWLLDASERLDNR